MLVPLSWLKEYVPLPPNTAELVERLTLTGLEAAGVRVFGLPVPEGLRAKPEDAGPAWDRDKVVVAKVLGITKHPNADKLKLVELDYGGLVHVMGHERLAEDHSAADVAEGLAALREGDSAAAGVAYERLTERWRAVRELQFSS